MLTELRVEVDKIFYNKKVKMIRIDKLFFHSFDVSQGFNQNPNAVCQSSRYLVNPGIGRVGENSILSS